MNVYLWKSCGFLEYKMIHSVITNQSPTWFFSFLFFKLKISWSLYMNIWPYILSNQSNIWLSIYGSRKSSSTTLQSKCQVGCGATCLRSEGFWCGPVCTGWWPQKGTSSCWCKPGMNRIGCLIILWCHHPSPSH